MKIFNTLLRWSWNLAWFPFKLAWQMLITMVVLGFRLIIANAQWQMLSGDDQYRRRR